MDADAQMETANENEEIIPNETKEERFKRIATKRLRNVLTQMRLLSNCSSSNYAYNDAQIELMFNHIDAAYEKLKAAFTPNAIKHDDLPSL